MLLQTQDHLARIHPFYFEFQYIRSGLTVQATPHRCGSAGLVCAGSLLSPPLSTSPNNCL